MAETLTILETVGPLLTKVYKSDGTVASYDDAASFKVREKPVSDIASLSALLTELQDKPQRCMIHGQFVGKDKAQPGKVAGTYVRNNANFIDQPLHSFMLDIDKFKPSFGDPVDEPEICILEFLRKVLGDQANGVSFHWQLSSSAGQASNRDVLKAHVWFWLEAPRKCSELYEWAKMIGPQVDKVVYRRAQIHYTANPIFEEGRDDPVAVRSGLFKGSRDTLPLLIDEAALAQARDQGAGEGGSDMKLLDPSEKDNLVGIFHKTFTPEQVLLEILEGQFEQISQRRFTWLDGGGTPEGVWVHDDGMHVGSSHNTWPVAGIMNLWDTVRVFKFGHLDTVEDEFEQINIDTLPIQAKPSNIAMLEWVAELDEIQAAVVAERSGELVRLKALIDKANDTYTLEHVIAPVIRATTDLDITSRAKLEVAFKERMATVPDPAKITIDVARRMLAPVREETHVEAPGWAGEWAWVVALDKFMNTRTKETMSILSYNASYDRYMHPYADSEGNVPKAADMSLRFWGTKLYSAAEYGPGQSSEFSRDGLLILNTYRPDLLPKVPDSLSKEGLKAIETVKTHIELLVPDARDRALLIDFMAYCVQFPGRKIRWAPLVIGMEGDGKTALLTLMGQVMGSRNVRLLSNKTLESDFTGWAGGQCLIGVEEVKLHNHNRFDIFNALKPIISNDSIEVHAKGKDPVTVPNFSNLFMLTNHPDAMPVSDNDRRLFFVKSPFRSKAELYAAIEKRTGMEAALFHDQLFDVAIKGHPGALRKWLLDHKIASPDFKPNGRAPENDMRTEAIELSRSDEEIYISGLIDAQRTGIYPNLVAGIYLTRALLSEYDLKIATSRLSAAMSSLGFMAYGQGRWNGDNCRWYYKGERPASVGVLATTLEEARKSASLEGDFHD